MENIGDSHRYNIRNRFNRERIIISFFSNFSVSQCFVFTGVFKGKYLLNITKYTEAFHQTKFHLDVLYILLPMKNIH